MVFVLFGFNNEIVFDWVCLFCVFAVIITDFKIENLVVCMIFKQNLSLNVLVIFFTFVTNLLAAPKLGDTDSNYATNDLSTF